MDKTQITLALLGSAAVGALVSSGINLLAQYFERKVRRQELLLKEALALAQWRLDRNVKMAHDFGHTLQLPDKIVLAGTYYGWIDHLTEHGKLPDDPRIELEPPK